MSDRFKTISFAEAFKAALDEMGTPPTTLRLTSLPTLDSLFNGLRPNEFSILCGATGTGKTTLCANISASLVKDGIPQYIASVETGFTDYIRRVMSAMDGVNYNIQQKYDEKVITAFMEKHQHDIFTNVNRMSVNDNRFSVDQLLAEITEAVETFSCKVAIVDNINFFLEVTSQQNAVIEMDRVVHEMIMFCKRTPVHLILIMHPRKTSDWRVENEFDIKGSSTAVQEAHNVFILNRPHPQLSENMAIDMENDREVKFVKMRRGGSPFGKRLIFSCENTVRYHEKVLVTVHKGNLDFEFL